MRPRPCVGGPRPRPPAGRPSLAQRLVEAARAGNAEAARAYLREGTPPDVRDEHGWAPLHWSACNGHVSMCELLLEFKADLEASLPDHSTPLMLAAEEAHLAVARLLLQRGALTACKDEDGFTALDRCDIEMRNEFASCLQQWG